MRRRTFFVLLLIPFARVLYLVTVGVFPELVNRELPKTVLEGTSYTNRKIADLSGNNYRVKEDEFFLRAMRETWEADPETRGIKYKISMWDCGVVPAHTYRYEDGTEQEIPESYVTLFQFRRAE